MNITNNNFNEITNFNNHIPGQTDSEIVHFQINNSDFSQEANLQSSNSNLIRNKVFSVLNNHLTEMDLQILQVWIANKKTDELIKMEFEGILQSQFEADRNKIKRKEDKLKNDLVTINFLLLQTIQDRTNFPWIGSVSNVFYKQTFLNFVAKIANGYSEMINLFPNFQDQNDKRIHILINKIKTKIEEYQSNEIKNFATGFKKFTSLDKLMADFEKKTGQDLMQRGIRFLKSYAEYYYPVFKSDDLEPQMPEFPSDKLTKDQLLQQAHIFFEMIEDAKTDFIEKRRFHFELDTAASNALESCIKKMQELIKLLPSFAQSNSAILVSNLDQISYLNALLTDQISDQIEPTIDELLESKNYKILKKLGEGTQATVFLVEKQEKKYVVKIMKNDHIIPRNQWWKFKVGEVNAMKVRHLNILGIRDVLHNTKGIAALIMDFLPILFFDQVDKGLAPVKAKKYMKEIALGLKALHDNGIAHHDLKLENVMINEQDICKLIDFGFSINIGKLGPIITYSGTPEYVAPEIFFGLPHGVEADVFSFGVLLYIALTGYFPPRDERRNVRPKYRLIKNSIAIDLIKKTLASQQNERLTIDEVLRHPYFND